MYQHFTGDLGRLRTDEMIVRAERYRLAQKARVASAHAGQSRVGRAPVYRRVLAAAGLSSVA